MITFNSNNIIVGYIKEFLATFNLPKYKNNTWTGIEDKDYYFNKYIPNKTKNLKITSNAYDSYTHEYLGQYLRFYRDFKGIDLLPLYNCFSNNTCEHLKLTNIKAASKEADNYFMFNSEDTNYKIYMIPVLFDKQYTFAIDSFSRIEVCCGIYGDHQNKSASVIDLNIPGNSYQVFTGLKFSNPVLIDLQTVKENIEKYKQERGLTTNIYEYESDLKLFIKVPISNLSSIVLLEGNYLNYNDTKLSTKGFETKEIKGGQFVKKYAYTRTQNYYVTNFDDNDLTIDNIIINPDKTISHDYIDYNPSIDAINAFKPITPLQLLRMNTNVSYPFADRLIEYLLGNVVTDEDEISDNVTRAQRVIELHNITKTNQFISGKTPEGKDIWSCTYNTKPISFDEEGLWENKIRPIVYNSLQKDSPNNNDINHDILGYIDKDIEKFYTGVLDKTTNTIVSISNIDLYPDMYKDSKEY